MSPQAGGGGGPRPPAATPSPPFPRRRRRRQAASPSAAATTVMASETLSWFQAVERGRKLAKGDAPEAGSLLTVARAVDEYARDLAAREAGSGNASRIRKHISPALAAKPVAILTARELSAWRDGLLREGLRPASYVRLKNALVAALNLAARRPRSNRLHGPTDSIACERTPLAANSEVSTTTKSAP